MIGALMAGATLLNGVIGSRSASQATRAATENNQAAIDAQERAARAAEARLREGTEGAIGAYEAYGDRQLNALRNGYRGAAGNIRNSNRAARGELRDGYRGARDIIRTGLGGQMAINNRTFQRQERAINPMIQSGDIASGAYDYELGIGRRPDGYRGFELSPDYQFRMDQGLDAVQSSAAAGGGLFSGATMRALNDYAQGVASQGRGEYMDRLNGIANRGAQSRNFLAQLEGVRGAANAGARASAVNTLAGLRSTLGQQTAGYRSQMGQNLANLNQTRGNNLANIFGDMGRGIGGAYETLGTGLANNATRLGANQAAGFNNAGNIAAAGAVAQGNVFNNTLYNGAELYGFGRQQGWWGNPGGGPMNANQLMSATVGAMGGPTAATVRPV